MKVKRKEKVLSIIIAFSILFASLGTFAISGLEIERENNSRFTLIPEYNCPISVDGQYSYFFNDDETITIDAYFGTDTDVIVPGEIDGHKVSDVGALAFWPDYIKNMVSAIGECGTRVEKVTLPKGLTKVDFQHCLFKELVLPDSVTSVRLNQCDVEKLELHEGITEVHFYFTADLDEITIPSTVTSLDKWSFFSSIEKVVIMPNTVDIPQDAFINYFGDCRVGTIYGYENSFIHYYTNQYNIPFKSIGVFGDCSGDGKVNGKDILALRQFNANMINEIDKEMADVNLDGKVNSKDALALRKFYANITDYLGSAN